MYWVPVACTQAETEAKAQGRDTPHAGHAKPGFLSTLKRTYTPEVHGLAFAELDKKQIPLNKL